MGQNSPSFNTYTMSAQSEVGKAGEVLFEAIMKDSIRRGKTLTYKDVRGIAEYREDDIDYIRTLPNNREERCEVKTDTYKTGRLYAEFTVNSYKISENNEIQSVRSKQGWLHRSKADMIYYYFLNEKVLYIIERKSLCAWIDYQLLPGVQGTRPFIRSAFNRDEKSPFKIYFGIGVLIPCDDMMKAEMLQGKVWKFKVTGDEKHPILTRCP